MLQILIAFLCVTFGSHPLFAAEPIEVRCAVIGGMTDTGLWSAVAERFERSSGHRLKIAAQGNKRVIAPLFERGDVDLLTMHSSDTVINLVADGYGENPQPWARNDLLIVGPSSDPAGIKGEKDSVVALKKIIDTKSPLLMHASLGTNEVLADLLADGELILDPAHVISLPTDKHRQMLQRTSEEKAYTLVGRIPFLNGKIDPGQMQIMVQGDERLRRPYVVIVSTAERGSPRHKAAAELAAFLRSPETQTWLKEFGKGKLDDQPLFFPVELDRPAAK